MDAKCKQSVDMGAAYRNINTQNSNRKINTADDIFKRKKLGYREDILDNMCSEELADNIFRIAQTEE